MWSWFTTLRNCFGNSQKPDRNPSPPPARLSHDGPLATSRRNELVPARRAVRAEELQWGQNSHPRTPGSQRAEVLRPLTATGAQLETGSQGLRNRYASQSEIVVSKPFRGESQSPTYHSAQASRMQQASATELTDMDGPDSDGTSSLIKSEVEQIRPVNLHLRLAAEAQASAPSNRAEARKRSQVSIPTAPGRRNEAVVASQAPQAAYSNPLTDKVAGRAGSKGTRFSQAHKSPARVPRTHLAARPGLGGETRQSKACSPPLLSARRASPAFGRSASPSSATLKRKSGNISASPAMPGRSTRLTSAERVGQGLASNQKTPRLNSKQEDHKRAAPRARLTINVGDSDEKQAQCNAEYPAAGGNAEVRKVHGNNQRSEIQRPPWLPISPLMSKSGTAKPKGKENEDVQDTHMTGSFKVSTSLEVPLVIKDQHQASVRHLQIGMPESPASNPGNSPQKCHFMFSSNNALGTPNIVGLHNQDERYREDKRLRVHKTPFELRVDRLIEKEQAYKEQVALRRRAAAFSPVQ